MNRAAARAVVALIRRPALWPTAVRQLLVLIPRGWWRRGGRLPLPDAEYLEFRTLTQYGDQRAPVVADDLVTYLEWCRAQRAGSPRR